MVAMSRNGTLEDALKSISDFNKHHQAEERRKDKERRVTSSKAQRKPRNASESDVSGASVSGGEDALKQADKRKISDKKKRSKKRRSRREASDDDVSSSEEDRPSKRSRTKSSKNGGEEDEEDSDEDRRRRKERRKRRREKEREDSRRRKEKRRRAQRNASSSDSDLDELSDEKAGIADRNSADAIQAAETVLNRFPSLQSELVQLLSTLDAGQAVDISSIPDPKLKSLLTDLFLALGLRKSPLGLYLLPESAPKTLQTLAPVLSIEQNEVGHSEQGAEDAPEPAAQPPVSDSKEPPEERAGPSEAPVIGPAFPPSEPGVENGLHKGTEGARPVVGPAIPDGGATIVLEEVPTRVEIGPAARPPPGPKKRVIGPAAPPPEVLQAAAKLTEAEDELRAAYEEDDVLIGPPPPALVAEAEDAPEKERFDEVYDLTPNGSSTIVDALRLLFFQVIHILAPTTQDPYTLLRVKPDASASEIKKRYWKLSLLVHPDKCTHPQAQNAFTVLNKAFKEVEDPAKRAIVDAKLAEIQRKAEFAEEMKALREAAEWRKLRGQSEPGDEELLGAAPEEEARDTWMTELPPERQAGPAVPMQSTYFSAKERTGRGDTSGWTDNPQEKAKKAQQQYLEAYSQAMLGPSVADAQAAEKASVTAQIIDSYNSKKRAQSLVEKHQEAMLKEKQNKKKKKKEETKKEEWEGSHPWKPWDREKDLVIGKSVKLDKDASATALASRFGAARPEERRFL